MTTYHNKLSGLLTASALLLGSLVPNYAQAQVGCTGKVFNPVTDPNWNDLFPINIMGSASGPNSDPATMAEPAVCTCPDILGIPYIGMGVTFWAPQYIGEIERVPGCLATLGGIGAMPEFSMEQSEQSDTVTHTKGGISRMQVNWYQYPVFGALKVLQRLQCVNSVTDVSLVWTTPIDPTWQNDLWGIIYSPESVLFANPIAQAACAVDAIATSFTFPIDAMFWCAGSWGSVYPLTGNGNIQFSNQATNGLILGKFLAKEYRLGAMEATTGPQNECSAHISPVWVKSQFRVDEIGPTVTAGDPVYFGKTEFMWGLMPPANYPTHEASEYLVWVGEQCCVKVLGIEDIISFFLGNWAGDFQEAVDIAQTAYDVYNVATTVVQVSSMFADIQTNYDKAVQAGQGHTAQTRQNGLQSISPAAVAP